MLTPQFCSTPICVQHFDSTLRGKDIVKQATIYSRDTVWDLGTSTIHGYLSKEGSHYVSYQVVEKG